MYCDIDSAVRALQNGDVAALPTETVYGLAGSIFNESAIRKIFTVKGRPLIDPLIVHILNEKWLERCADFSKNRKSFERAKKISKTFWPGPITIIVKKNKLVSDLITAGSENVAIRCPRHEIFREILIKTDFPIAAPSANPFGYVSPTKASHVFGTLGDKVKFIVDGGECTVGLESTIVDITKDTPKILRPGGITLEEITECLGEKVTEYTPVSKTGNIDCPGQLAQHYSPKTQLTLLDASSDILSLVDKNSAIILLKRPKTITNENVFWLSEDGDLATVARSTFDMLQKIDNMHFSEVFCQIPPKTGIGEAIVDRLTRAAAKWSKR